LKYYKELLKLQCFSRLDVEHITGSKDAANSVIANYKRKKYIDSVRRNLFVTLSLDINQPVASRYKIASSLRKDSYVSHHTAFEYYGCANQVFHEVYVSGERKFTRFEYDDITYTYIASRLKTGIEIKDNGIRVSSMERTIIDSINDYEKISGIEELLQCLELVPYANEGKLLNYLQQYDKQILYQKTGYILEHFKKQLRISDDFFTECRNNIEESVRYLYKDLMQSSGIFNSKWKLVVPNDLMQLTSKGDVLDAPV